MDLTQAKTGPAQPLNQDAGLIKLVAMLSMLIDHVGAVFFPGVLELRIIGRLAFPLYCFSIVMGLKYTRSWPKYALRLLVGGLAAQPGYMLALRHGIMEWNVMATLLLGLLSIVGMREKRYYSHIWAPLISLVIAAIQPMDYGWRGVLLIQLMYLAQQSAGAMAALMTAFCLYWGSSSSPLGSVLGLSLRPAYPGAIYQMVMSFVRLQGLAILSLPLMIIPTRSGIRVPKWLGYAFYPGHLLILGLLRLWL